MNVYDFDHTLYPGDASLAFWRWCLRRHPRMLLRLPAQGLALGLWLTGLWGRTRFKEAFFAFLRDLPDPLTEVCAFWAADATGMASWYLTSRREDDCIVSASPTFLVQTCPWLPQECTVIATEMAPCTGRITGKNCRGEEKVRRFRERFPTASIDRFCSDSLSDAPLAALATRPFLVSKGQLTPWVAPAGLRHTMAGFRSVRFLRFLFCGGINVATGVGFAWGFSLALQANVAFVAGYALSHALSYVLNARLTFRQRPTCAGYLRYIVAYLPNFTIQNGMVLLFHNLLGVPKTTTYLASALLAIPVTFIALSCYAFARRHEKAWAVGARGPHDISGRP